MARLKVVPLRVAWIAVRAKRLKIVIEFFAFFSFNRTVAALGRRGFRSIQRALIESFIDAKRSAKPARAASHETAAAAFVQGADSGEPFQPAHVLS